MSDAGILAALDGWLGDGEAPPANLTKPDIMCDAHTDAEQPQQPAPDTCAGDEAALCDARAQAFIAIGIPAQSADMLAGSLMRRDRQLDDRRSCAECMSFHGGACLQRITPIGEITIHTLHRCRGFELNEVLHD